MVKKISGILMIGAVVFGALAIFIFAPAAHAQVTTTWSVASTTALGANAESNASGNAYNMYLLIVPITLGLAAAYFALRWVWHRIAGRH